MKQRNRTYIILLTFIASMILLFLWLGDCGPRGGTTLQVRYTFIAGLEKGAPVRMMGLRCGKVKKVTLEPPGINNPEPCIVVTIDVDRAALNCMRSDAHFYITMAGLVGEKYIEITPGTSGAPGMMPGTMCAGVDPPRLDLLLAQSSRLAELVFGFMERNEQSLTQTVDAAQRFLDTLNRVLVVAEKRGSPADIERLLANLTELSGNMAQVSGKIKGKDVEEILELTRRLLEKADRIDEKTVRKFLQEEGVRARIF